MVSPVAEKLRRNEAAESLPPDPVIFGRSEAMQAVADKVQKLAASNLPVLLQGESGTGKDIIARLLHQRSPWQSGPWVKVSCPAIPKNLVESEFFGSENSSFAGAFNHKSGRAGHAHRGTLFLDEIAELEPHLQARFLELLQDGQFCRIEAKKASRFEARILCATNRDLESEMQSGSFRRDLFYRINVVNIHLPPLRERGEDVPHLARYFLDSYNHLYNRRAAPFSAELLQLFARHDWPGNIRELENLVKRHVILNSEKAVITELFGPGRDHPKRSSASCLVTGATIPWWSSTPTAPSH
jgi:transcriptional regulator with PAS, ATPase and Fis domain